MGRAGAGGGPMVSVISGQSFAETLDTHVDELPEDVANTIRRLVQAINQPPQVEEQPP
jgi:hypothetical protein